MPTARVDDSLEVFYEDDDFTDPWKAPEVAVLLHCHMGTSALYYRWAPVLARRYRFIRPDRRGYGRSTIPDPGYAWSLQGWAGDLERFLDALDISRVHLIGEAVGAFVGVQFAAEHPERVSSLTLINFASPRLTELPGLTESVQLAEAEGIEAWVRQTMPARFQSGDVDPDYVEWHAQLKIHEPKHVSTEVLRYMTTVDVSDQLRQVTSPTLIVANDGSHFHPPEMSQGLLKLLQNAQFKVVRGIPGYIAHVAPEECAAMCADFASSVARL